MAYSTGYQIQFGPPTVPKAVRILLIANSGFFLLQFFSHIVFKSYWLESLFALNPEMIKHFFVWQFLSYSFLHGDFMHLLFNMLALWMFGSDLEDRLGSKSFLKLYFFSVLTGGLLTYIIHISGMPQGIIIGASGGVFGVLVAYAMVWPNREILFMMIFPLKTKYFIMILMLMIVFSQGGGNIAHMAHLGGALGGFVWLYYTSRIYRPSTGWTLESYLKKRRAERAQKEWNERIGAKARVDEILEKISTHGMNSLSREEKNFLKKASKNYYTE